MTNPTSNVLTFAIPHTPPMTEPRTNVVGDEDYREHVATIVGAAIRSGRRKGRSLSSLLPQLRKWLLELCDKGDPSAIMVRDWLTGNRRYLAAGFDIQDVDGPSITKLRVDGEEGA